MVSKQLGRSVNGVNAERRKLLWASSLPSWKGSCVFHLRRVRQSSPSAARMQFHQADCTRTQYSDVASWVTANFGIKFRHNCKCTNNVIPFLLLRPPCRLMALNEFTQLDLWWFRALGRSFWCLNGSALEYLPPSWLRHCEDRLKQILLTGSSMNGSCGGSS